MSTRGSARAPSGAPPAPPRLRVRPNRHAIMLALVILAVWYAGETQSNGAVFLLGFLLAAMALLSWLHARANLRGLEIRAGSVSAARAGQIVSVPVELRAKGREARGVEVSAPGARAPWLVPRVEADGRPVHGALRVVAREAGARTSLAVVARSRFPLGIFTAEYHAEIAVAQTVHPRPEGELPLPPPLPSPKGREAHALATSGSRGEGGDFTGVRSWQKGDSLRHVDWKAVARERPLMVKTWGGDPAGETWLVWTDMSLPESRRAGQIARWIEQCAAEDRAFGLRLPDRAIAPSRGTAHVKACLDALSAFMSEPGSISAAAGESQDRRVRAPTLEAAPILTRKQLLVMAVTFALTTVPMLPDLSITGALIAGVLVISRLFFLRDRHGGPANFLRYLGTAGGVAAVYATHHTLLGLEPGVDAMLVIMGAKFSESSAPRDFQVLGVLCWFLCMCSLALDQSLERMALVIASFAVITGVIVWFRLGGGAARQPARASLSLVAQALPLVVLLFLIFPRGTWGFVGSLRRSMTGQSGVSDVLEPGSLARVALDDAVAFRASFPDGAMPPQRERYWRCLTLSECAGLSWSRGSAGFASIVVRPGGAARFRQRVMMQPHGQHWLPALDTPFDASIPRGEHFFDRDSTLWTGKPVSSQLQYDVTSAHPVTSRGLSTLDLERNLAIPAGVPPALRALAEQLRADGGDSDEGVIEAALDHLRAQAYQYTLEPGTYDRGMSGLEDFLLRRRLGFCEHFSAAFAALMRLAGVPARIVVGYVGGEFHEGGGYLIVRQSDAHAWTEAWIEGEGWRRVDPTAELAPGRLAMDLASFLSGGADGTVAHQRQTWWWRSWQQVRLAWDYAGYLWYQHVVRYDEDEQRSMLASLGLRWNQKLLWALVVLALAVMIAAVMLWLRRSSKPRDPAVHLWRRVCARLERSGIQRAPGEGPLAFAARAGKARPESAEDLARAAEVYAAVRYGSQPRRITELARIVRKMRIRTRPAPLDQARPA